MAGAAKLSVRRKQGHGFFFQAEDGIRDVAVTGVQTCALPIFEHGADAAGVHAADEVVADAQGAVLHEHRCDRPLPRIELRLDHGARGATVRVRLQVEDLRSEERRVGKEGRSGWWPDQYEKKMR